MAAGPALSVSAHWWEVFQHRTTTTGRTSSNETVMYDSPATSCCWYIHLWNSCWFLRLAQLRCAQKENNPNGLKACVWAGKVKALPACPCMSWDRTPEATLGADTCCGLCHLCGGTCAWHITTAFIVPLNPQSSAQPLALPVQSWFEPQLLSERLQGTTRSSFHGHLGFLVRTFQGQLFYSS